MIRQGRTASALLKEASALQQLHHPNIVRIFGCVCVDGSPLPPPPPHPTALGSPPPRHLLQTLSAYSIVCIEFALEESPLLSLPLK
jgi:hypothetical protein